MFTPHLALRGLCTALFALLIITGCKKESPEPVNINNNGADTSTTSLSADSLRMNEIQVIGSHNSYRLKTYQPIYGYLQNIKALLPANLNPDDLDYTHEPLLAQFNNFNVRKIELDIYYDPNGGLFYERQGNKLVNEPVESGIAELQQPGFKIIHIADIDYETHHYTFKDALQTVKSWSEQHPQHVPFYVLVEAKETGLADALPGAGFTEPIPFSMDALNDIDAEIKAVFGAGLEGVLTPDDVRGEYSTLNEAVITVGWPKLAEARGKVVFLFNNSGLGGLYKQGHPSLQGRVMFTNEQAGTPEAAFIMHNNPDDTDIKEQVQKGYLVRTRADAGTTQARNNDYSDFQAALASGAQIISTDYYRPDPRHSSSSEWSNYTVQLEEGVARVNPVNVPEGYKKVIVKE